MKLYNQAELIASDLRDIFLRALEFMTRCNPKYAKGPRSVAGRMNFALQKFSNELRVMGADADQRIEKLREGHVTGDVEQYILPLTSPAEEKAPFEERLRLAAKLGEQCGCRYCVNCSAFWVWTYKDTL